MPTNTTLTRIRRTDFFAILAPGLCLVVVVTLFLAACITVPTEAAAKTINKLSGAISKNWLPGLTLVLFAYLVGSILRAIPVNLLDEAFAKFFRKRAHGYDRVLYKRAFPYRPMLKIQLKALQDNGLFTNFNLPEAGTSHTSFNLWKLDLCEESPATFEYTQELESRVRLFSGMIWAAVPSLLFGLFGAALSDHLYTVPGSRIVAMTVGSVLIISMFVLLFEWPRGCFKGYDLSLMSVGDTSELPSTGGSLVIIALIEKTSMCGFSMAMETKL